ncbi:hypothetical protein BTS2_0404 [Bacillus sp. TS-2]|nr:hypothetical protein BTS2_0404 [Bacillus sp. TS-2]
MQSNAEKMTDSPADFANWLSMGGLDMAKGAVNAEEAFSKEHWLSSFGLFSSVIGVRGVQTGVTNTSTNLNTRITTPNQNTPNPTTVTQENALTAKLPTLPNIREWSNAKMPEIGLVQNSMGGYHFLVRKNTGGGSADGAGAGTGGGVNKGTVNVLGEGTVWKNIKITQPLYEGTKIPKSFELVVDGKKFWVHPNGTKHMVEYITRDATTHGMPINSQTLLSSFQKSVKNGVKKGIKYEEIMNIGTWELIFSKPRGDGLLPVIKHAVYRP